MKATKVNAGLAESNGSLLPGIWRDSLHVTCGLTACTPGSAPGPTLGNEYGKTLLFYQSVVWVINKQTKLAWYLSIVMQSMNSFISVSHESFPVVDLRWGGWPGWVVNPPPGAAAYFMLYFMLLHVTSWWRGTVVEWVWVNCLFMSQTLTFHFPVSPNPTNARSGSQSHPSLQHPRSANAFCCQYVSIGSFKLLSLQ